MKKIHQSDLNLIQSVFHDTHQNRTAYELLTQFNKDVESQLEFACPLFQGDSITWLSQRTDLEYKSVDSLSEIDRQQAMFVLSKEVDNLKTRYAQMAKDDVQDWLKMIFKVPSKKSIYASVGHDATHVVLTEWGFLPNEFQAKGDILEREIEKQAVSLIVKVVSETNRPQLGHKISIQGIDDNTVYTTNESGIVAIPSITHGQMLDISSLDYPDVKKSYTCKPFGSVTLKVPVVEQPSQKEVEEKKDDPPPPPPPPPHKEHFIQLVDKKNRPIVGQKVTVAEESIGSNQMNRRDYTSDSNGHLKNFVFDNSKSYRISTWYRMSNWEGDIQQNQSSDVTAVKIPYVFPWLWVLLGIFFFMMWFIPFVPIAHSYVVKDINGNRVENQVVECLLLDKKDAKTLAQETNSMGQASFDLGSVSLFRYVFWPRQVKGSTNDVSITSTKAPFVSPVDTLCVGVVPE